MIGAIGSVGEKECLITEDEYKIVVSLPDKSERFYVKNSYRNFIYGPKIVWDKVWEVLLIPGYHGPASIDTKHLASLSVEYNVDLKIFAYLQGIEYSIDFEVHKGIIIKEEEVTDEDYIWECPHYYNC
ncbi:hypothetical protein D3C76_1157730 [compost metagenome]